MWYISCFVLFICSLLSKGMAITLPFILLLIDYLNGTTAWKKRVVEKIPFFFGAIVFAVVGVVAQQESGAMEDLRAVNPFQGFFVACHNILFYIFKLFVPIDLSAYHPYPNGVDEALPWYFYVSCIPVLGLFFLLFKWHNKNRLLVFSVLFFLISIAPVIQFLPFGTALLSERYVYMPYLGLYLIVGWIVVEISKKLIGGIDAKLLWLLSLVVIIGFGYLSNQRVAVWENGLTLWSDVVIKYPYNKIGYANRSEYWRDHTQYDKAIKDMEVALECDSLFNEGYSLLAFIHLKLNHNETALELLNQSLKINDKFGGAFVNRAIAYSNLGKNELALKDFNWVIDNAKEHPNHYFNRANIFSEIGAVQQCNSRF